MKVTIYNRDMKYYSYFDVVVASYNKNQAFNLIEQSYHNNVSIDLIQEVTRLHAFGSFINELGLTDSQLSTAEALLVFGQLRNDFICYGFNEQYV